MHRFSAGYTRAPSEHGSGSTHDVVTLTFPTRASCSASPSSAPNPDKSSLRTASPISSRATKAACGRQQTAPRPHLSPRPGDGAGGSSGVCFRDHLPVTWRPLTSHLRQRTCSLHLPATHSSSSSSSSRNLGVNGRVPGRPRSLSNQVPAPLGPPRVTPRHIPNPSGGFPRCHSRTYGCGHYHRVSLVRKRGPTSLERSPEFKTSGPSHPPVLLAGRGNGPSCFSLNSPAAPGQAPVPGCMVTVSCWTTPLPERCLVSALPVSTASLQPPSDCGRPRSLRASVGHSLSLPLCFEVPAPVMASSDSLARTTCYNVLPRLTPASLTRSRWPQVSPLLSQETSPHPSEHSLQPGILPASFPPGRWDSRGYLARWWR